MAEVIHYAGVGEPIERKLRQAAPIVTMQSIGVTVGEWDSGPCDLLVAGNRDQAGQAAITEALRRNIPVITVAEDDVARDSELNLPPQSSVSVVIRVLKEALEPGASADTVGVCRLGNEAGLRGHDLDATINGRTVSLRPSRGRVFAASETELKELSGLLAESDWRFRAGRSNNPAELAGVASMSLEAFLIRGADANAERLPMVPHAHYELSDWPDLGAVSELIYPLKVTRALMQRAFSPGELAARQRLTAEQVNACLWGLRAGALLSAHDEVAGQAPDPQPQHSGVSAFMARLSSRFGLFHQHGV